MRLRSTTWIALALALAACNDPAVRRDADQAADATKAAGEKAGAALEKAGEQVQEAASEAAKAAQPTAEDLAITAKVKAKLAADPEVSALAIDVDTRDHVVTLSGDVPEAQRAEAEKLARDTEGVRAVINMLGVHAAPAAVTPAAAAPQG